MRLKKKRALKRMRGADDDDEPIVTLGGPESEVASSEEEVIEVPSKKRVKIAEGNEELRALALLGNDDF